MKRQHVISVFFFDCNLIAWFLYGIVQFHLKLDSKEIVTNILNEIYFIKTKVIKNLLNQNKKYILCCEFSLGFIDSCSNVTWEKNK